MRNSFFSAVAFMLVAVCAGYFVGSRSWKGVVYLSDGTILNNSRTPAAIKRELDFSRLDGAELITATQKRLVSAARVISTSGKVGIELGHFVTRDANGQRRLACDAFYNRLTLRFEAEGMASAGEKPAMEVDGPCRTSSSDISSIEPIWIPVQKIFAEKPSSMDLDFNEDVKFKFNHVSGNWPVRWSLQAVRLYNSQEDGRTIDITTREMHEIRPKPLVVNWLDSRRQPSAE